MSDDFDDLDSETLERIGDPIVYRPAGGAALAPPIMAWVDHGDEVIDFNTGAAVVNDVTVQVRKLDVAAPTRADVIELPRTGLTYIVKDFRPDRSARYWNLTLKVARA